MPEVAESPHVLTATGGPASALELKPAEAARSAGAGGGVRAGARLVWAVIPCFNRPADLALVLEDLTALDLTTGAVHAARHTSGSGAQPHAPAGGSDATGAEHARAAGWGVHLKIVVVDNASATPLSAMKVPAGLDLAFLRLNQNTGGAGGYNAGMAYALGEGKRLGTPPEFVWLVDSDVRLEAPALRGLIDCLDARPDAVAAGHAARAAGERRRIARLGWVRLLGILDATSGRGTGHEFGPALRMTVPIFNRNQGGVARAEAEFAQLDRRRETVHNQIVMDVRTAFARYQQARAELDLLRRKTRPEVEAAIKRAEAAYKEGNATYLIVLEANRQLIDTYAREAALYAELRRAWAELERGVGRRLAPPVPPEGVPR